MTRPNPVSIRQQKTEPAADGGGSRQALSLELITTTDAFVLLREEWNGLVQASGASVFQTFDWLRLWWKHYGNRPGNSLFIMAFRSGGRLVGLAPFFRTTYSFLGHALFLQLRLMGCGILRNITSGLKTEYGPSDYLDIVVEPSFRDAVLQRLAGFVREERRAFDEILCANVPDRSLLAGVARDEIASGNSSCAIVREDVCPQLRIPSSVEDYLRGLKQKVRRRFSQALKASGVLYEIRSVRSQADLERSYGELLLLHQRHWNDLGYPGQFADDRFCAFQREVAGTFFENGWLWFKTANAGGRCVAAHMGFVFNGCIYVYVSGFDKNSLVARRRPGLALILSMIQDGIDRGAGLLDFLRGDESYKFDFTQEVLYNWRITVRNPDTERQARVRLYRAGAMVHRFMLLLFNEFLLLRIHLRVHGLLRFIPSYARFRISRISERYRKLRSAAAGGASSGAAAGGGENEEGDEEPGFLSLAGKQTAPEGESSP